MRKLQAVQAVATVGRFVLESGRAVVDGLFGQLGQWVTRLLNGEGPGI
ncbi:hypothetical protein ACFWY5_56980 [Nonomuraea sp. NPDC059007]